MTSLRSLSDLSAGYCHKIIILSVITTFRILKKYKNFNIKSHFKKCFVHIELVTFRVFYNIFRKQFSFILTLPFIQFSYFHWNLHLT